MRDVQPLRSKAQPKGAVGLTAEQLRDLLQKLQSSKFCRDHDLVDPITLLIATGLRRSELLGPRWIDYDDETCTVAVTGKVIRVSGAGLKLRRPELRQKFGQLVGRQRDRCLGLALGPQRLDISYWSARCHHPRTNSMVAMRVGRIPAQRWIARRGGP